MYTKYFKLRKKIRQLNNSLNFVKHLMLLLTKFKLFFFETNQMIIFISKSEIVLCAGREY